MENDSLRVKHQGINTRLGNGIITEVKQWYQ